MWRIKRRRTKPKTKGNKVIYPKLNATAKPNRYQSRNTYLDVKCNKKLGAGCTNVGCQCQDPPNITSFSDITNVSGTGVVDYKTRVNTIAPASFHDFTTWYGPATNLETTYQGVYGNSAPPSGNANFSLPLPAVYNHISITYNNPHPGSGGGNAVYIFIGGVGSGALPTENPLASQAVNEIENGTTGASKTYSQRYQAGDYLKIQEKASVITTALVIELTYVPNIYCCKTAPYRNPILGYRKHLIDCSGNTDLSGCGYTKDVSGNVYKDNYAKTCATHPEACYNQVIRTKQNKNGCVDESYNYSTNQYLNRRCLKFQQQEFNFLSQVPVDNSGCGTKFAVCPNCQLSTETAATSIIVAPTNDSANTLIYTRDGNTWIGLGNDIFSSPPSISSPPSLFVKNNDKIWVAGGKDNTGTGGTSFGLAYSIDGINWTGTQTPPPTDVSNVYVQNAAYSNNLWMAIADYVSDPSGRYKILSSSNGIDWVIKFNIQNSTNFEPSSIEYGNGTWIIFGEKNTSTRPF